MKYYVILALLLCGLLINCTLPTTLVIDPYIERGGVVQFSSSALRFVAWGSKYTMLPVRLQVDTQNTAQIIEGYLQQHQDRGKGRLIATPLLAHHLYYFAPQYPAVDLWILGDIAVDDSELPPNVSAVRVSRRGAFADLATMLQEIDTTTDSTTDTAPDSANTAPDSAQRIRIIVYRRTQPEREELLYLEEQLLATDYTVTTKAYTHSPSDTQLQQEKDIIRSGVYQVIIILMQEHNINLIPSTSESSRIITENMSPLQAQYINNNIVALININWIEALNQIQQRNILANSDATGDTTPDSLTIEATLLPILPN